MAEDFARATGAPQMFTINGKPYFLGKLTPRALGDIQAFLKEQVEDPRSRTRRLMEGLPDSVQLAMWQQACEEARSWPPSLGDEGTFSLLLTEEGQARILWIAFRRHNPAFTLDEARKISAEYEMSADELNDLIARMSPKEIGDPLSPTKPEEAT
jgi:hypothetical protein